MASHLTSAADGDYPSDNNALVRCLSLDVEAGTRDKRIYAFAGVRLDTGETVVYPDGRGSMAAALTRLDNLSTGAEFLLGHNIIAFDLDRLHRANTRLRLLNLPVVDTLRLNPLAFPKQPYHHLVKHYQEGQLDSGRFNDPELDARLVIEVFAFQQAALAEAQPALLTAWHWLTTMDQGAGFDLFFSRLRREPRPTEHEALTAIAERLDKASCRTQAKLMVQDVAEHPWEVAYVLAWLSVAGGDSVMPTWVRHRFPRTAEMVKQLRDRACAEPDCEWCRKHHDARRELFNWFGFDQFRPEPKGDDGRPLQQSIVEAAMAGEHVLGVLPTGTGKSLCYQLPALSRYHKTGALTVVISPLVALMADQVAGLKAQQIDSCVTINGMLSMPERSEALESVRMGDASILLISPEQLRSVSVRRVLALRDIGMWVLDEAHCLSRWGHDFRPDYRYVARYMKERHGESTPPVLCLTATAKPAVKDEIIDYFSKELGVQLQDFDGGARRVNLEFEVVPTQGAAKLSDIYRILERDLPADGSGGAIVYCATRRRTEDVARFLQKIGIKADHFHAGLLPQTKQDVQSSFIDGELRVIAATNAFGMGIDKHDVRLVIHADIPGSLENYLQEAGRAGRDQKAARCVLLYSQDDVENQFGMSARSRLKREEINGVLRSLRRLEKTKGTDGGVIATVGEILGEDEENLFERDSATDDTRVRSAVGWLEETDLLKRVENRVQVFPSSLRVRSLQEVRARLDGRPISSDYRGRLVKICERLFEADPDEGISTDELVAASGLSSEDVARALHHLADWDIASNDTALTAFVHSGVERSSKRRFEEASTLERALIDLMEEKAPDMEVGDSHPLNLRFANQELKNAGHDTALPQRLRRIVRGIAADGRGEAGDGGSLAVRSWDRDTLQVTLQREWRSLVLVAELRRNAAGLLLDHLLSNLPGGQRGTDLLAETTLGDLMGVIREDPVLSGPERDQARLIHRALLWLHEQEVIKLNKGLTVLRPAMTIRLQPGRRGFTRDDYSQLQLHYDEQVCQVHVMAEYAEQGLSSIANALQLSMDYFQLTQDAFLRRWLPDRDRELSRQTTADSWHSIVDSLGSTDQRRIVTDDREQTNALVLAGPGSGKTRVLVHRIAYLVRVRRENPRGILALAYNRHAAVDIRRRLAELIGDDARGVTVMTCHAFAMRLGGTSFAQRSDRPEQRDFTEVIHQATALLNGDGLPPDEANHERERLLAGYRWILVDEYQDIGEDEYALISALAGRSLSEGEEKLTLFAVGDDDQNIYAFNGSSTKYIRQFANDYNARPAYLIDNYRSTAHIIEAANAVIEPARDRMKSEHAIVVDRGRRRRPPGGAWTMIDRVAQGRVQVLPAGNSPISQAQAVVAELQRLSELPYEWDWAKCAVIGRQWDHLDPIRSICELQNIPVQLANEEFTGIWYLRETRALLNWLDQRGTKLVSCDDLNIWLDQQTPGPWVELLREGMSEYALEVGEADTEMEYFTEWLAEWGRDARRQQRGLLLVTAHSAKGLEFDHVAVLDGGWNRASHGEDADAPRRLYYVAMTRARETLTLARLQGPNAHIDALRVVPSVLHREAPVGFPQPSPTVRRRYRRLSLRDVFLGFAGRRAPSDPVHQVIAELSPGDRLHVRDGRERRELLDENGIVVGELARNYNPRVPAGARCIFASVMAVVSWNADMSETSYGDSPLSHAWEVVVPELVFELD